jgi:hypothetical protein
MTDMTNSPSDLRLRGQEAISNVWQELAVSASFVFDGLSLRDASGTELAWSIGKAWLLDDGRKMLGLTFEADRNINVKAVGRHEELLNANGAIRVNGAALVIDGRTVLTLDGRGRWNQPSNSRVRFRVLTIE